MSSIHTATLQAKKHVFSQKHEEKIKEETAGDWSLTYCFPPNFLRPSYFHPFPNKSIVQFWAIGPSTGGKEDLNEEEGLAQFSSGRIKGP